MQTETLCSCGCGQPAPIALRNDARRGWIKGQAIRFRNGHWQRGKPSPNRTHGMRDSREHHSYMMAKYRCTNPNSDAWKDYGGRGILFKFDSFEQFFAELGPRPEGTSIDRINNDGNYEPGNVRWATAKEQRTNQRTYKARCHRG